MRYIVTGCDGQLGGRVANNMLKEVSGDQLIFTCPFLEYLPKEKREAWEAKGVTVRQANYDNKDEMVKAFQGGDRIYFVSSIINGPHRVEQHKNVIDACKEAGVKHITYTSFFGANREGYHQYVLEDHRPTEAYLKESGVEYNIMRNNLYMENYLTVSVILAMLSDNVWGTNACEGKATYIAKDDSAACATALLLGKGEPNKDYDLTSLTPVSQRDICEMIAQKSGIAFKFVAMSDDEFRSYLEALHIPTTTDGDKSLSPVPFCTMDMVTNEGGIAGGQMGVVSHDVERLIGRKPLEITDLLDTYSYVWKEKLTNLRQLH
ncbi:NAD(P)-dependent oxidoreductase [Lachnospiraceae bacterium]|jgi:NAD(P)H dehydrogenase (quinone)|nr:NmrA family NAD(P)-binding protein [uncultured Schaedlerella sp.]NBI60620.1 NAD(P)-dependent oxidoreductase [Lachnospiraceae bacterium]